MFTFFKKRQSRSLRPLLAHSFLLLLFCFVFYGLSNMVFNLHHPPPYKIHTSLSPKAQNLRLRPIMFFWASPTKGDVEDVDDNSEEAG